jgi:protein phosphatase
VALRIAEEASVTDVGRQRHTNEDAYFADAPVFGVADGMGGAQAGEVASALAVEQFEHGVDSDTAAEEELSSLVRAANRKIFEMAKADSRRAGMGTTLTAVVVRDHDVSVGHVGDSRLYLLRDGTLQQLTRDHSLVQEFVDQGRLTREQAEKHPQRSVITRALGPESDVKVDTFTIRAKDGDVFLLCSDGLSGMVPDESIQSILSGQPSLGDAARALVEAANKNGGRDNITAVLFRLEDDGTGPSLRTDTAAHDTIAGDMQAPSTEEIETARAAQAVEGGTAVESSPRAAAGREEPPPSASAPPLRASPAERPVEAETASERPRRPQRRGRLLAKGIAALVVLLVVVGVALYAATQNVWFLGTNDQGSVTLYRGLPYDLPLGVKLYTPRYVSGVPALSLTQERRKRVLDHQLRSKGDAVDLMRSLDSAATR